MAVRIEKILCPILDKAHDRQGEETSETLSERPRDSTGSGFLSAATPFLIAAGPAR
jgi:hypothetical protein